MATKTPYPVTDSRIMRLMSETYQSKRERWQRLMETLRRQIKEYLRSGERSLRDISQELRISEKDALAHLGVVVRSLPVTPGGSLWKLQWPSGNCTRQPRRSTRWES